MVTVPAEAEDPTESELAQVCAGAGVERSLAERAFARLPQRWQAVLWHTEIEGRSPAEAAPLLGLTPNGVSSLVYRAREGLRVAYLRVHGSEAAGPRCRAAADRLGAWTRGRLTARERVQIEAHLDACALCRELAAELGDLNGALRAFAAPLTGGTAGFAAPAVRITATGGGSANRQLIGAAAAAVALAAAIAVGIAAGGSYPAQPAGSVTPTSTSAPLR